MILGLQDDDLKAIRQRISQVRRPYESVPILLDISEKDVAKVSVNQYKLPGISIEVDFIRSYPFKDEFAHSIGYVGRINAEDQKQIKKSDYIGTHYIGKLGVEKFYETTAIY